MIDKYQTFDVSSHTFIPWERESFGVKIDGFYINQELWEALEPFQNAIMEAYASPMAEMLHHSHRYWEIEVEGLCFSIAFFDTMEEGKLRFAIIMTKGKQDHDDKTRDYYEIIRYKIPKLIDKDARSTYLKMLKFDTTLKANGVDFKVILNNRK